MNKRYADEFCLLFQEWENQNTVSTMTYCILLISFIFNIFIFCYIGELLTEQVWYLALVTKV